MLNTFLHQENSRRQHALLILFDPFGEKLSVRQDIVPRPTFPQRLQDIFILYVNSGHDTVVTSTPATKKLYRLSPTYQHQDQSISE